MRKIYFLLFILILLAANVYSQHFDIISTGDPVLQDIRFLSIATGKPFLSFTPPLAPGEIMNFLLSIDSDTLPEPAKSVYHRALGRLTPQANLSLTRGVFTASLNINANIEAGVKLNEDVKSYPENPDIVPFLALETRLFFSDKVLLYLEPSWAMRPTRYNKNKFDTNIAAGYFEFDEAMPLKAFAAGGGDWWTFFIGRDRLFWGTGNTGSLSFSDNSQYFDFARLSFFSSNFKYTMIINQLPLRLTDDLFDSNIPSNEDWWNDKDNLINSNHRYFYLHRFDLTLFNRITLGIMEGVMIGNSPLELKYLNPFMVFHSMFSWNYYDKWRPPYDDWVMGKDNENHGDLVGSFMSFDLNWNIVKNFSFYGQLVVNEFAEPGEIKRNPQQPPNGFGYMAGFQFSHVFSSWASLFYLEFVYTDPYLNILSSPFGSFIQQNHYKQYYYIGYQRDTIVLSFGGRFFNHGTLQFWGAFSFIVSGEHNINGITWDWKVGEDSFNQKTPSGIAEKNYVLSLGGSWKPYSWLILKSNITGIYSQNNNHILNENKIGGQISFCAGFRY